MSVQHIPDGYHTVTPYLTVNGADEAIAFYVKAFGAEVLLRLGAPDGSLMHAEIKVGDSPIMLTDANPAWDAKGPDALGGTPVSLAVYVENVDDAFQRAIDAGAEEVRPVQDQFYGDRAGTLRDPYGHVWTLATHIEDLEQAEIEKRFAEMMAGQGVAEGSGG
jgi:PhnB protein